MKTQSIRLFEAILLIALLQYRVSPFAYTYAPIFTYASMFLIFVLVTDLGASILSEKSLSSSYLSNPKIRVFYISCGLLLATFTLYCLRLWGITPLLGEDTQFVFARGFLPLNIATAIAIILILIMFAFTNPSKNKLNFMPIAIGALGSIAWWAVIYQKCKDNSIIHTINNMPSLEKYTFYIGTAVAIIFVTIVATLYMNLKTNHAE